VFIIPYQINDYTVGGCFPVKFHDALSAGLPVVVTDLPAYAPLKTFVTFPEVTTSFRKMLEKLWKKTVRKNFSKTKNCQQNDLGKVK